MSKGREISSVPTHIQKSVLALGVRTKADGGIDLLTGYQGRGTRIDSLSPLSSSSFVSSPPMDWSLWRFVERSSSGLR